MISICVPSWNSLDYLKILYASFKCNTRLKYELIVHDNGSQDGTYAWCRNNNIILTRSEQNEGFCGVNHALKLAKFSYILIANSDMYALPFWDLEILKQINKFKSQKIDRFTISCSLIEPFGKNPEYIISYHGRDTQSFDEGGLLADYLANRNTKYNTNNTIQYSHPILIPKFMLEEINYLDEHYFPGWNVDNDIPRCLYEKGCMTFIMLTKSRFYHFISKTFSKLPNDIRNMDGKKIFFEKWGETADEFRKRINVKKIIEEI
jgi:GT2 family glycosyltransferase